MNVAKKKFLKTMFHEIAFEKVLLRTSALMSVARGIQATYWRCASVRPHVRWNASSSIALWPLLAALAGPRRSTVRGRALLESCVWRTARRLGTGSKGSFGATGGKLSELVEAVSPISPVGRARNCANRTAAPAGATVHPHIVFRRQDKQYSLDDGVAAAANGHL